MTPNEFRQRWEGHTLTERSAYQQHFMDLCALVGHETPIEQDKAGDRFCFEKAVTKQWGGKGFADVWKRDHFGWEYKGPHANLDRALDQLLRYRRDLENPPILVVCDTDVIRVHTDFERSANTTYEITTATIGEEESLRVLRAVFHDPDALRPSRGQEQVTEEVATRMGDVAQSMRERGVDPHEAAHFLMKMIFCLFSEDIGLLRRGLMTDILERFRGEPERLDEVLRQLFASMKTGRPLLWENVDHFNGWLFADDISVILTDKEIESLAKLARDDWASVEPAIFGTLFERGLDPRRRSQLGAHYTSKDDIELVIEPVLMAPLRREWDALRAECDARAEKAAAATGKARAKLIETSQRAVSDFMDRLTRVRVLDPACGSGNFLYVALNALKNLEKEVIEASGPWNVTCPVPRVDPEQLFGIEIDDYAVELAQLTVWIGYLQWSHRHGFLGSERPLLKTLDNIRRMDAILEFDADGNPFEPEWPACDVIVGNPPFLGDKKLRSQLGDDYVDALFVFYKGRVPNGADLCCYWFERARTEIAAEHAKRAGLLATNSIRQGKNRAVLDRIATEGGIFTAWSDKKWILDGAAVRISIVGFDDGTEGEHGLNGASVGAVNADLTAMTDLTAARRLAANARTAFVGTTKKGPFDIPGDLAERMLSRPNPHGKPNSDVLAPYWNGSTVVDGWDGRWIIDFGEMSERDAALYEAPFEYVRREVLPVRVDHRERRQSEKWWLLARPVVSVIARLAALARYAATPRVAKHRLFVWVGAEARPDCQLIVFARDDDYFLGVLHSRPHEVWALAICSSLEDRPRYGPTTCFETFPFPRPTEAQREAIGRAAKALTDMRDSALANDESLTLTKLYNKRPTWLDNLHRDLDRAVLDAYGWPEDISDEDLLERLLALNLEYAAEEERGIIVRP